MSDLSTDDPTGSDEPADDLPGRGRRSRLLPTMAVTVALVVVLALGAVVTYAGSVDRSVATNLQQADELPPDVPEEPGDEARPPKSASAQDAVNYVIIGSDSRTADPGQGRSDVLMLLHLDGDRRGASLISFPRDLYVPIPGHGKNKINAAYAFGGAKLTVRTLEGLLDVRMDHVAIIDFAGFVALTDQLGGVTVDNPYASVSQGHVFPVGRVEMSGQEALAYVRERKQLPGGDLSRAERQRLVLQSMLRKVGSRDVLLNPVRFNRFVGAAARQVTVDRDLTPAQLRKTAVSIRFKPDDLISIQAPIDGFGTSPSGQSIDKVDTDRLGELKEALKTDGMEEYAARYPVG